jgi:hypothetical protein
MSKTLFVITSPDNEYDAFWGFGEIPVIRLEIGGHNNVVFIKRQSLSQPFREFCPEIIQELRDRPSDEVGIIIHLLNGDEVAASIGNKVSAEAKVNVTFSRWYSREQGLFWDGTTDQNNLPYNAFRVAIKKEEGQVEGFERVWSFFLWDQVLEAKLELLQDILNGETPDKKVLAILRKELGTFDEDFVKFEKVPRNDLFAPRFQRAFEKFRNALEIE